MFSRRTLLAAAPAALAAAPGPTTMTLCMHQTTSAAAGYRRSLEGYAKAGIRLVEIIPQHYEPYIKQEGVAGAKRLLADLGLKAVSSGGVRGIWEPNAGRTKALEELKARVETVAALGIDRMVCPCNASDKFTLDDFKRGADSMREVGDIVKPFGVTAMVEFMRGSTFLGTLPTALNLIRQAAHPNVRPMLDCYHFWAGLSRFEDLQLIRQGEIHHMHFQDVPNIPREMLDGNTREIPGDGIAPLARILGVAKEKGYTGPLSVELFLPKWQNGDPFEVASEIRRKADAVMGQAGVL